MSGVPSQNTSRAPGAKGSPASLAAWWARTTPATELRSATPSPARPISLARSTSSSPWEAPRRNEKLVVTANSAYPVMGKFRQFSASPEQPMQEPARLRGFAAVQAFAVEPGAQAVAAFDAEVIARQRLAGFVAPPLHGDALGALGEGDLVQHAAPAEPRRRPVRDFGDRLHRLRTLEQADRTGRAEAVLGLLRSAPSPCFTIGVTHRSASREHLSPHAGRGRRAL